MQNTVKSGDMSENIGKMPLVKEESEECDLKAVLTYQHKCESEPIDIIKWEDHKSVPLKESDVEEENDFCLKIITLQEVKKEEEEENDYWDPGAFETPVELNANAYDVTQGLNSSGVPNDSFHNGQSSLGTEENVVHPLTHRGEKTYQCSQCGKRFFRYDSLKTHTKNRGCFDQIPPGKKYSCSHCGKKFATLINFIVHQQIHRGDGRGERPFHCSQCGKRFYREKALEIHMQNHKREKPHCCSKCGKSFTESCLMSHQCSHTRERLYRCSKCAQSFASETDFERHMRMHSEEIMYSCAQCKNNFPTEGSLNKHKKTHIRMERNGCFQQLATKDKLYSCSNCSRTFTVLTHYIVHQQIHRGEGTGERPFCCLQCGKRFYREHGLKSHQQSHTGERIHHCSQCGKSFRTKSFLISHKRTHVKKRLCHSSNSARSFTSKSMSERPMQMHSEEKCCNVSYSGRSIHAEYSPCRREQAHTGKEQTLTLQQMPSKKKSYSCSHCGRTFTALTNFIAHQQIHRGEGREERPFCCSQCGKRFYKENSLKKHQQVHTGGRSHHCSQCGKSFRTKSVLRSHEEEQLHYRLKHPGGFASKNRSDENIHIHSRGKSHSCFHCGETFPAEYLLKRHKQTHAKKRSNGCFKQTQTKKYCCSTCGKIFTTLTDFIVHQQIHRGQGRGDRPVYVSQGGKCFDREGGQKTHVQFDTREMTEYDDQLQPAPRETASGDGCLENAYPASTGNSGRGNTLLVKDGESERHNTDPFETLPEFDMGNHSFEHVIGHNLQCVSDVQNVETYDDTSERPLMAYDIVPPFYSEEIRYTTDCTSTGTASAVRNGPARQGAGNGDALHTHNTVTDFGSAERSMNSGKIVLALSKGEPLKCDLTTETEQCSKWKSELLNKMKQESSECITLGDGYLPGDHRLQKNILEETKKEEGLRSRDYITETATELSQNILHFNQEMFSEPRRNHSSSGTEDCMEGNFALHQQNQTGEEISPCSPWGKSIGNYLDSHLQIPTGRKNSFQQVPPGNKTYRCSHCGKMFNTSMKYIVHLQIHRGEGKEERPFSCSQCGKSFYREDGLKTHQRGHSDGPGCAPRNGGKSIGASGSTSHQQNRTAETPYHCPLCDKLFACQRSFWAHRQTHCVERPGSRCGETFIRDSILKRQWGMPSGSTAGFPPSASNGYVSGEILFGPPVADAVQVPVFTVSSSGIRNANTQMTYNTESRFENEEVPGRCGKNPLVTKDPSHKCVPVSKLEWLCDWESEAREEVKREDNEHASTRADCMEEHRQDEVKTEEGARFILETSTDLNSTLRNVTHRVPTAGRHDGSFTCAAASATDHHATLAPARMQETYQRSHCGESLNTEHHLQIQQTPITEGCHIQRAPLVEKSYLCARCGKSFATITNYFVHLQIHRGERPFSCSQCGKSYYKEESLKTHQQSH